MFFQITAAQTSVFADLIIAAIRKIEFTGYDTIRKIEFTGYDTIRKIEFTGYDTIRKIVF